MRIKVLLHKFGVSDDVAVRAFNCTEGPWNSRRCRLGLGLLHLGFSWPRLVQPDLWGFVLAKKEPSAGGGLDAAALDWLTRSGEFGC